MGVSAADVTRTGLEPELTPRSFALGADLEAFIDAQVASGRFDDADAVVRPGLRLLQDQAADLDGLDVPAIRRSIEESRRDGRTIPAQEVFSQLEARYRAMAEGGGERAAE